MNIDEVFDKLIDEGVVYIYSPDLYGREKDKVIKLVYEPINSETNKKNKEPFHIEIGGGCSWESTFDPIEEEISDVLDNAHYVELNFNGVNLSYSSVS